jgi:hypothetical protein
MQEVDIQNVLGRKGVGCSEPKVERLLQCLFTFRTRGLIRNVNKSKKQTLEVLMRILYTQFEFSFFVFFK